MSRHDPMIHVRVPQELKDQISQSAEINRRSLNAEIVLAIEQYLQTTSQQSKT